MGFNYFLQHIGRYRSLFLFFIAINFYLNLETETLYVMVKRVIGIEESDEEVIIIILGLKSEFMNYD